VKCRHVRSGDEPSWGENEEVKKPPSSSQGSTKRRKGRVREVVVLGAEIWSLKKMARLRRR